MRHYYTNSSDSAGGSLIVILITLLIIAIIIGSVNSNPDWNNGICPDCNIKYELRGSTDSLNFYLCPKCNQKVKRYVFWWNVQ